MNLENMVVAQNLVTINNNPILLTFSHISPSIFSDFTSFSPNLLNMDEFSLVFMHFDIVKEKIDEVHEIIGGFEGILMQENGGKVRWISCC